MIASNEKDRKAKMPADKPGALAVVVVCVVVGIISPRVKVTVAKVTLACAPISELLFGVIRMMTSTGVVAGLFKL